MGQIIIVDRNSTGPTTTVHIERGEVRKIEFEANGTPLGELPAIDFVALAAALGVSQATKPRAPRTSPSAAASAPPAARQRTSTKVADTPTPVGEPAPRKATKAVKAPKAAAKGVRADDGPGRPYHRRPEIDDIASAYTQTGGDATAMADHFKVPKHTIYGWLRSLRNMPEFAGRFGGTEPVSTG